MLTVVSSPLFWVARVRFLMLGCGPALGTSSPAPPPLNNADAASFAKALYRCQEFSVAERLSYIVVYYIQILCQVEFSTDKFDLNFCLFLRFLQQMFRCSFYLAVRKQADEHLVDGTGHRPHYSLRTLCRALKYVVSNPCKSIQRSLYDVGGQKHFVFSPSWTGMRFWFSVEHTVCMWTYSMYETTVCSHSWEYLSYILMVAGLLYEFSDSAG